MKKLILFILFFSIVCYAQSTNTPNMNLPVPIPGVTPGPQWAQDINSSFILIDQHNHTPGFGVQIPPAGLNINTALSFQNNSAIALQASVYQPQATYSTDYGVHVEGVDLYYVDGNGNDIKLTSGGTVNATSSGIASGTATASFNAGVLVVNANTNTPANIQAGSILLGNNAANSKYLTLSPPAAMGANFTLTLPNIPGSQSFMAIDASGNMSGYAAVSGGITGSNIASATVTRANQVAVGQQVSSSSGNFTTTNSSLTAVTNLSVTITTSGRPVILMLQPASTNGSRFGAFESGSGDLSFNYAFARGGTAIGGWTATGQSGPDSADQTPGGGSPIYMDAVSAGTYTYTFLISTSGVGTAFCRGMLLVAYEL
jgi:hypothetical protein